MILHFANFPSRRFGYALRMEKEIAERDRLPYCGGKKSISKLGFAQFVWSRFTCERATDHCKDSPESFALLP